MPEPSADRPQVSFHRAEDFPWEEVLVRHDGGARAAVRLKILTASASAPVVIVTEYDPGMVVEAHAHRSDHVIFITRGSVTIGGVDCPAGTAVVLPEGAVFGPLVAGPDGTGLIEFYAGDDARPAQTAGPA